MKEEDLIAGSKLILKDFQLEEETLSFAGESISYDLLRTRLIKVIEHLLSQDFNRLLNALYRIDVSEEKLKSALARDQTNPASTIAEMIIERELQKVETRRKYS